MDKFDWKVYREFMMAPHNIGKVGMSNGIVSEGDAAGIAPDPEAYSWHAIDINGIAAIATYCGGIIFVSAMLYLIGRMLSRKI